MANISQYFGKPGKSPSVKYASLKSPMIMTLQWLWSIALSNPNNQKSMLELDNL